MNKMGYGAYDAVLANGNHALNLDEFNEEIENGALVLDVRSQGEFIKGYIPNSLFIGLDGTFAMWVGALIEDLNQKLILIVPEGREEEAVKRLARVGYDNTIGYLKGGVATYKNAGNNLETITSVSSETLAKEYDGAAIIDVRKPGEFEAEHVENATTLPLDYLNDNLTVLNKNKSYHIHCAGGYRSVIAISLLKKNGYTNLIDVAGGFAALSETAIPKTTYVCPTTLK
jgi:rhodanese-related sulfurtransferase